MTQIRINVYRAGSAWFGARWIGDEYDGCDELPIDDASESEAIEAAKTMPLVGINPALDKLRETSPRVVVRVADLDS